MRKLFLIGVFGAAMGCVADLTPDGTQVAQRTPSEVTTCQHVGVVDASEGMTWSVQSDRRSALNQIRNKVAERGGNVFVINDRVSSDFFTSIQADGYKC
jgi:hypothetical protein